MRLACAFCLGTALGGHVSAQAVRFPTPFDFATNFAPNSGAAPESGSRDGWESFPITQETGYEPSLQPETSGGVSALTRELAPTRDGYFQLGFVRRVHLISGDHPAIRFRLRVPYLKQSTVAHLHIFRGAADEQHDFTLTGCEWQQLATKLNASPEPITAIALAVDFPNAVHTRAERVSLTDLHLSAMAAKHIPLSQPAALWDATRELFYLKRSLKPGEELSLSMPVATHWTLTAPDTTEAAHGEGKALRYAMPNGATPGIWTIHLQTADAESTALLLVRSAHPRGLIFDSYPTITPQQLASIRERKAQLEKITTPDAGRNIAVMSTEWLLPGLPSYFAEILQPSELAMMDAMLFRATGDQAAREEARMLLRTMASWPMWVHPWFAAHGYHSYYPVGLMDKYIVMSEEFLGNDLPTDERNAMDRALLKLSVEPVYEEYVHEDRLQFNYSNWIGNTVGGALIAALISEDPDAGGYALGLYVKERDHVRAAYTSDGSYGEGISYHRFDLETTALAAAAAKRLLGVSMDDSLLNGERYMRYAAYSPNGLLDFGDSHVDLKPSNVFAYIAALNKSPLTTDFYFRYRDEGTAQILPRVLWEAAIKPVTSALETGPPSAPFAGRGVVVMRDSWQPDSTVLAMRAGINFNHNHADQGSFFYASHGVVWLGEAGYADYYKDLNYNSYNTQAIGHNVLLVDSNPESQVLPGNGILGSAPAFTHTSFSDEVSIAEADLTTVYPSLRRYKRTLIHLTNGPTVVVDDVAASSPRRFSTVWHPGQEIAGFVPESHGLQMRHGDDTLQLRVFADADMRSTLKYSPFPLAAYERSEHEAIEAPRQLEVTLQKPATKALMVAVISPKAGEPAWTHEGDAYVLTTDGWQFRLHRTPQHGLLIDARSPSGKAVDLRAFSPLMGTLKRACSGVFIGENAHESRGPALHLRGKRSSASHR